MKASDIKRAAWFVAAILTALGMTVCAGTPWGSFCTHLATAIGLGFGFNFEPKQPPMFPERDEDGR